MSVNLDRFQNAEPEPAKVIGICGDCLCEIQEGYLLTCNCGEKIHKTCKIDCASEDCVRVGCYKCFVYRNVDGEYICEECYDKLAEERKNLIESVMATVEPALSKQLGYWYTNLQEIDKATILEYITSGKPPIHIHIGKEITE